MPNLSSQHLIETALVLTNKCKSNSERRNACKNPCEVSPLHFILQLPYFTKESFSRCRVSTCRQTDRRTGGINGQTVHCATDRLIFCSFSLRGHEKNCTNDTVNSTVVRQMSLIFRFSGCFYGYIGRRRG